MTFELITTANDLAIVGAIISKCASIRKWDRDGFGEKSNTMLQEVQCAMLNSKDKIFISGNHINGVSESEAIGEFLEAFDVTSEDTLINALAFCKTVLETSMNVQSKKFGAAITDKFSIMEKEVIERRKIGGGTLSIPLANEAQIKELVIGKNIAEKNKAWAYRNFLQAKNDDKDIKKGATNLKRWVNYNKDNVINVIGAQRQVHAELNILAFLTKAILTKKLENVSEIYIGGLKPPCVRCFAWIRCYSSWIKQFGIKIILPDNDSRSQFQNATDWCCPTISDVSLESDEVFKALFCGGKKEPAEFNALSVIMEQQQN